MFRFLSVVASLLLVAHSLPLSDELGSEDDVLNATTTETSTTTTTVSPFSPNPFPLNDQFECHFDYQCGHGVCKSRLDRQGQNTTYCDCDTEYATEDSNDPCSYHRKSRGVALLLSILQVPAIVGAYWFYLAAGKGGYIFAGVLQIFLIWGAAFFICCGDGGRAIGSFLLVYGVLMVEIAWIVIVAGGFPDGNGVDTTWYMP
jgi:hypothetical protein